MVGIAAVTQDLGLGKKGDLLFHLRSDLQQFKRRTLGKVVIYGRQTLNTFPHKRPLPGRLNLILSTKLNKVDGAEVYPSIEALEARIAELKAEGRPESDLIVIGGATIYQTLMPRIHEWILSEIDLTVDADVYLPDPRLAGFVKVDEGPWIEEVDGVRYRVCRYLRRQERL